MLESGIRSSSAPTSPSPSSLEIANYSGGGTERLEIENLHLRQCISQLQLELRNVRAAALTLHESLASSQSQLKVKDDDIESLRRSSRELAQRLDRAEAHNAWLEEHLRAVNIAQAAEAARADAPEFTDMATDGAENEDPVCSLSRSLSLARTCSHASEASQQVDGGSLAPGQPPQPPQTLPGATSDQFTFSPVSPRALAAAEDTNDDSLPSKRRRAPPPGSSTAPGPRRLTYGCSPRFHELRRTYDDVLQSSQASEDPVDRWMRTVLSSSSAVDTDPKNVEPVLAGLAELCESNGLPLPLHRLGPCQFQLGGAAPGRGGARLRVRLVNGRLMARSGPAWLDFFAWLERQPLHSDQQPSA